MAALQSGGYLDENGRILAKFDPKASGFELGLDPENDDVKNEIISMVESNHISNHIKKDEDERPLKLNKQVFLDPEFETLWNTIKAKTTYSVEYSTDNLIANCIKSIEQMEKIEPIKIFYREGSLELENKGIKTTETRNTIETHSYQGPLPDIIAYVQKETELTRRTIVKILTGSGRIMEFAVNPQKFMDAVVAIIKKELHRLIIDGIKYEKISDQEYSMQLFEDREVISYLNNRLDVKKSVYDAIVYDSEIESDFANKLDEREDIKLFVKLPNWFRIVTPIGDYNPDWAILKHDDTVLYLVRETKSTKNFEKLRNLEAEKIRCGRKHFAGIGVNFDVVVTADEI